jgi:arylsulfatase
VDPAIAGRPDLMAGRTSLTLAEGMTGMGENIFLNVKNRSKTITAEIDVPPGRANGALIVQGGRFGGRALYVKDGVPAYDYNFLGLQRTTISGSRSLAPGKATIRFEFDHDGGGGGGGEPEAIRERREGRGRADRADPADDILRGRNGGRGDRPRHARRGGDRVRGEVALHGTHSEGDGAGEVGAVPGAS